MNSIIRRAATMLVVVTLLVGAASAASPRSNVTLMTYSPGHGTQVEYYDAKGNTFLWYPGNRRVVPGHWKVEGKNICFGYAGNSYNPVTGHTGSGWECMALALHEKSVVEHAKGDIFRLSSGKVPFPLQPGRTTFAALKQGKSSPAKVESPIGDSPQAVCRQVIADAGKDRNAAVRAALLYYHAKHMGERCTNIKADYVKALTMLRELGETGSYASLLKDLRSKASTGNPRAVAALAKLGE